MKDDNNLEQIRHSFAHLLAAAVEKLYPKAKATLGPAIENGFYYDFDFASPISEADLGAIEGEMKAILREWQGKGATWFKGSVVNEKKAKETFRDNQYKKEIIEEIKGRSKNLPVAKREQITLYKTGNFTDLCRGGHAKTSKELKEDAFKLVSIAGAYWRGDEKNKMLTRIYGVAFENKKDLRTHLEMLEEAKRRDHKKIGKEMDLFTFSPLVGAGLPMFMPKGTILRNELEQFIIDEKKKLDYQFVSIPHIAKTALYEKSGHLGKYDAMMPIMKDENGSEMVLKAMNCPHHFEIYKAIQHSYKDMPLRLAGTTTVYRNEKSGELQGLTRVMGITQDDTHHFVRQDQIQNEMEMIFALMDKVFKTFGFTNYRVQISVRDPKNKKDYFGSDALWKKSEQILIDSAKKWGHPYKIEEGEAAFYGPKIDIMLKDSIGREWQLTTIQLDFNQPENFDLYYRDEKGKKQCPAIIHVAITGSTERFLGILIEHFAGKFPLWLAPVQARILAVSDKFQKYGQQVLDELKVAGIRAELADADESLGKRIRQAKNDRVPYILVVGENEKKAKTVSPEHFKDGKMAELKTNKFIKKLQEEIRTKKI